MAASHAISGRHRRQTRSASQPLFAVGALAAIAFAVPGMKADDIGESTVDLAQTTSTNTPTTLITPEASAAALKALDVQAELSPLGSKSEIRADQARASRDAKRENLKNGTDSAKTKTTTVQKKRAESIRPVAGGRISGVYGEDRGDHIHSGLDFAIPTGTTVRAVADGVVIESYVSSTYGKRLVIKHTDGTYSTYNHLSYRLVSEGQRVEMGQAIARSGNTGRSTGPHLHFEVLDSDKDFLNPTTWLRKKGVTL